MEAEDCGLKLIRVLHSAQLDGLSMVASQYLPISGGIVPTTILMYMSTVITHLHQRKDVSFQCTDSVYMK